MTTALVVDQPGIYDDMPEDVYHRDPVPGGSLSSTGARKLLPPSCPARFDYERRNPPPSNEDFDLGKAAHAALLGTGAPVEVIDAKTWQTKAAKEARAAAYAEGKVPLLRHQAEQVQAMVAAVRRHPIASALLNPDRGRPEVSAFWIDGDTGVWRRARFDWLPNPGRGRLIIPDYKTCTSADAEQFRRSVATYGYHQQAAWYLDGAAAVGLDPDADAAFVFICQEKAPPYLVNVVELDAEALIAGRERNRRALDVYRRCTDTGHWPGFGDDVELVSLPTWATRTEEN